MARKIVITSGKGGVGKTSVTASLGYALASLGFRTMLVDLDIGLNNLDCVLNVENKVVFDLIDVIEGRCRPKQALIQDEEIPSLYILPSTRAQKRAISAQNVKLVITKMNELFDYILIDCPAGIDLGFHRSVVCADEAIIVTTPHMPSIRDSDKVVKILKSYDLNTVYSVVNRVRGDLVAEGDMIDAHEVFEILNIKPLGIIPEDDLINCGRRGGKNCQLAYDIIAQNLVNNTSVMYDCLSRYSGIIGKIRRNLKKNA